MVGVIGIIEQPNNIPFKIKILIYIKKKNYSRRI